MNINEKFGMRALKKDIMTSIKFGPFKWKIFKQIGTVAYLYTKIYKPKR